MYNESCHVSADTDLGDTPSFRWMLSLNSCLYNHLPFCPFWGVLFFSLSKNFHNLQPICPFICYVEWCDLLLVCYHGSFWVSYCKSHDSTLSGFCTTTTVTWFEFWYEVYAWALALVLAILMLEVEQHQCLLTILPLIRAGVAVCRNVLSAMPHFELFDRHDAVLYRTLCGRKYI